MEPPELKRPALGDEVPLGALYDARSDTFLPNLFVEELPDNVVDAKLNVKSTAQLSKATTIRDKLTALGITPELGASILAGLAPINVYAPYLNNRNGYQRSAAQASLHYTITTVEEELNPFTNSNRNYRLNDMDMPTHMVIGITWGARFLVAAHCAASTPDDLARQQERLDSVFESLKNTALGDASQPSVSPDAPASQEQESSVFGDCDVSILGNVLPPSTLATPRPSPRALIDRLRASLVATNGGKGKQIQYKLMPLAPLSRPRLNSITDPAVHQPHVTYLERFIRLLDDWADARHQCMEYIARCERNNDAAITPDRLRSIKSRIRSSHMAEGIWKPKFGKILQAVRDGRASAQSFNKMFVFAENKELGPKEVLSKIIDNHPVDGQDLQKDVKDEAVTYASFREKWYNVSAGQP